MEVNLSLVLPLAMTLSQHLARQRILACMLHVSGIQGLRKQALASMLWYFKPSTMRDFVYRKISTDSKHVDTKSTMLVGSFA